MFQTKSSKLLIFVIVAIVLLAIFSSTLFLYNSYQQVNLSYNKTQEIVQSEQKKRLILNKMLNIAHTRSLILFYMSLEDDPFELDDLNQQFSDKGGEWIELRLELEKQKLNDIERNALNSRQETVNAVAKAQAQAAKLLTEGKATLALEILKNEVLPEQGRTFNILDELIGLYKNSTESAIKETAKKHHQDNVQLIILAIQITLGSLLMLSFTIVYIFKREKKQLKLDLKVQKQSADKLSHLASHDQLTNLPNRRYLIDQFNAWNEKNNGSFSVLFIDLDNFKNANDLHGHTIGDQILCEVASRISQFFLDGISIRQSGDEFIVLNPKIEPDKVLLQCNQFLLALKKTIIIGELEFSIGASIGIATAPQDGNDIDDLLRKADMAMYEAKKKNLLSYAYSENLGQHQKRRSIIESELTHAISKNEFFLVYQPQVSASNKAIVGIEALIRWNNSKLGMVPPDEFILIAESTGQIHEIGQYVFDTAIQEIHEVCKAVNMALENEKKIRLSVNISVHQLVSDDFLQKLDRIIENPSCITLDLMIEITESLFIYELDLAKKVLDEVRNRGITISLDDFGTGYSSLSVLSKLPINELKIDKSFVNDIYTDDQAQLLIQNIIGLGKSMGIPVLAEGVEDLEQAKLLTEYGCDLFQGYYFSKPLTKDHLIDYLNHA